MNTLYLKICQIYTFEQLENVIGSDIRNKPEFNKTVCSANIK